MERKLRATLPNGRFENVPEARSRAMGAIPGHGNRSTEVKFRGMLVRAGIRGWHLRNKAITGTPDFFFPTLHVAVFLDGCFWHGCPKCGRVPATNSDFWKAKIDRNRVRDRSTKRRLRRIGIQTVRFWEHELRDSPGRCIERMRAALNRSNGGEN